MAAEFEPWPFEPWPVLSREPAGFWEDWPYEPPQRPSPGRVGTAGSAGLAVLQGGGPPLRGGRLRAAASAARIVRIAHRT